jgi:hypothetical protein
MIEDSTIKIFREFLGLTEKDRPRIYLLDEVLDKILQWFLDNNYAYVSAFIGKEEQGYTFTIDPVANYDPYFLMFGSEDKYYPTKQDAQTVAMLEAIEYIKEQEN